MTRPFKIGPKLFVLSFCQFSRNSFSPLSIEVVDILPIDLFAFLCGRIGACDVENPVLHEVVIRVAAGCLSPAPQTGRCSPSLEHRPRHSVGRWHEPVRRILQNPEQAEAPKPSHKTINASKAPTGHKSRCLTPPFKTRCMCAGSPDSPLGAAIADFCGQAFVLQRRHSWFFFLAGKLSPFSSTSR